MLDLAKHGLASLLEDLGNRQTGVPLDFLIQVHEAPGELRGEQAAYSAFARAHKTRQGDNMAAESGPGCRLGVWKGFRQAIPSASVALQNLDCTTEGRGLDFRLALVHGAEQA